MRLELFCMTRPHYPYECTAEDLEHLGMKVRGMLINVPVRDEHGFSHIDVVLKPIEPIDFIYAEVHLKNEAP